MTSAIFIFSVFAIRLVIMIFDTILTEVNYRKNLKTVRLYNNRK